MDTLLALNLMTSAEGDPPLGDERYMRKMGQAIKALEREDAHRARRLVTQCRDLASSLVGETEAEEDILEAMGDLDPAAAIAAVRQYKGQQPRVWVRRQILGNGYSVEQAERILREHFD